MSTFTLKLHDRREDANGHVPTDEQIGVLQRIYAGRSASMLETLSVRNPGWVTLVGGTFDITPAGWEAAHRFLDAKFGEIPVKQLEQAEEFAELQRRLAERAAELDRLFSEDA